jgi:membrane protein DedA with SNARE-associated domain
MSDTMVSAAAGRRRATWASILLRLGLLVAAVGLLAASARLLGPWSPACLQGLLAAAGAVRPPGVRGTVRGAQHGRRASLTARRPGGLALGLVPGALATLVGMTAAACAQLLLGRRLTRPSRAAVRLPGAHRLQQALQGRGWLAVVVLRLAPGPFSEANPAAGLTPLRVRSMAVGTLVGGAPKALGWAALGLGASHLPAAPALVIATAVAAGLTLTVVWLRRRGQRPATAHLEPAPPHRPNPIANPPALWRTADNGG